MKTTHQFPLFDRILVTNKDMTKKEFKKILVLYDDKDYCIGDSCIKVGLLSMVNSFFPDASIDISWRNKKHTDLYMALLDNNPFIDRHYEMD